MNKKNKVDIYIRLLDEGIEVFRPTQAVELEKHTYQLLPAMDYNPLSEDWEFLPGTIVAGEIVKDDEGGEFLMAVKKIR